jgi:hypothetical protein
LLMPLKTVPSAPGRRGGGFSLNPVTRVAFDYEGRRWEQPAATLECVELHLLDAFLVLVADIARRLASSPIEVTWQAIVGWVEEWQSLLARRPVLTPEQQLGLWGELWAISNSDNRDVLIAAWRGPEGDATDFFLNGIGLEVKTSRQAHVLHVSQRQVESPLGSHQVYLLSIWVGVDPARGVSLAELVDSTLALVSDPPALLKKVASLGYAPLDRDQYATRFIPLETPRWFRAIDVPRVRDIDPRISQLRYVVTLDVDLSLTGELADSLSRHFFGAEHFRKFA